MRPFRSWSPVPFVPCPCRVLVVGPRLNTPSLQTIMKRKYNECQTRQTPCQLISSFSGDAKIANMAMQHFDSAQYGLRYVWQELPLLRIPTWSLITDFTSIGTPSDSSVKRIRKELQLLKTRQQGHTLESIHQKMCELKAQQPTLGFEGLRVQLRLKYGIHARRCVLGCHSTSFENIVLKMCHLYPLLESL